MCKFILSSRRLGVQLVWSKIMSNSHDEHQLSFKIKGSKPKCKYISLPAGASWRPTLLDPSQRVPKFSKSGHPATMATTARRVMHEWTVCPVLRGPPRDVYGHSGRRQDLQRQRPVHCKRYMQGSRQRLWQVYSLQRRLRIDGGKIVR